MPSCQHVFNSLRAACQLTCSGGGVRQPPVCLDCSWPAHQHKRLSVCLLPAHQAALGALSVCPPVSRLPPARLPTRVRGTVRQLACRQPALAGGVQSARLTTQLVASFIMIILKKLSVCEGGLSRCIQITLVPFFWGSVALLHQAQLPMATSR